MKNSPSLEEFSIKYILRLMWRYRSGLIFVVIFSLLWSVFELAIPFVTKTIVDVGIQNQDMSMVVVILIALFAMYVGKLVAEFMPLWILRHVGVRVNLQLMVNYWERILKKSYLFFTNKEQSEIIQHFNDNLSVEAFITTHSFSFFHAIYNLVLYCIVLFIFDFRIGVTFLFFTTLFFLWSFYVMSGRKKADEYRFSSSASIRGEINEIFKGIVDLKSNNREKTRISLFEKFHYKLSVVRLNLLRYSLLQDVVNKILHNMRDVIILYYAAMAVVEGTMTLGSLIAIQYLLGQLYELTFRILAIFPKFQDASLSINRINDSLHRHEPQPNKLSNKNTKNIIDISEKTIRLEGLEFQYTPDVKVLEDISFEVPFGRSTAILGESGSGKSTLLKNILKLLDPGSNQIFVGDYDLNHLSDKFWLTQCSTVLQESILFNRTLLYNITFKDDVNDVDIMRVWHCLRLTCADEFINNISEGLNAHVGEDGVNFSRGQVQRILLARAIYKQVDYYFFDEPFSALDRLTFLKVFKNIREELKDVTLLIVTHRREVAQRMDEILFLENGRVVEHGSHDELSSLGDRYFHVFMSEEE